MARRRKTKTPMDPAEAARLAYLRRRDPAQWGANEAAMALPANAAVRDEAETRTKVRRLARFDAFALLKSRGSLSDEQVGAVRRLESEIAVRFRVDGPGEGPAGCGTGDAAGFSMRAVEAGRVVAEVLRLSGGLSGRVLVKLLEPAVQSGQPVANWRQAVAQVTGELSDAGQVAVVRGACQNLLEAWVALDNSVPKRAAA